MQYNIGDIVFVANYIYKNGESGSNHLFVIIDEERAVDINYFGFLISSNINKAIFPYNELIKKNKDNGLHKDSIIKCDDVIQLDNKEICFKIGSITEEQLIKILNTFEKYLKEN